MGVTEKMWDGITTVIRMNDKIERMAETMINQQRKIEQLNERVIRLETALEIALSQGGRSSRRITRTD
jgi:galactokinase